MLLSWHRELSLHIYHYPAVKILKLVALVLVVLSLDTTSLLAAAVSVAPFLFFL